MGDDKLDKKYVPILVLLFLGAFIDGLDATIVNVALPTIAMDFDVTMSNSTWIILGYVLGLASLLIPIGKVCKNNRVKKFFTAGTVTLLVGFVCYGSTENYTFMVIFRIIQGVGAAMMSAAMPSIIVRLLPSDRKGTGMAAMGGASGVALILGPTLGGFIVGALSWHWIFFINVPFGLVLVFMAMRYLPADGEPDPSKDPTPIGGISVFLTVGFLLTLLQNYGDKDLGTGLMVACGIGAAAAFAVQVWSVKRDRERAIISPQMVFNREYMFLGLAFFLSTVMLTGTQYVLPYWLQISYGMSTVECGMFMTISSVAMLSIVFAVGKLVDRRGGRSSSILAQLFRIILCVTMILVVPPDHIIYVGIAMVFLGFSQAFSGTGHTTRMIHHATPGYEDESTNFLLVINYAAAAMGAVVYSMLIALRMPETLTMDIEDFSVTMMNNAVNFVSVAGIILLVLALVFSLLVPNKIPEKSGKKEEDSPEDQEPSTAEA